MTFLEELRAEAAKACRSKRYKELTAKRLADRQALDELREAMLAAAKEGCRSIAVPIEKVADKKWESVYSKDYRSREKARFDRELCEFLTLHFEGVRADSGDRWTIHFSWR